MKKDNREKTKRLYRREYFIIFEVDKNKKKQIYRDRVRDINKYNIYDIKLREE